jgi:hypothetical protein
MNKTNNKTFWWALGIFLLGFFALALVESPTDRSNFQCDRTKESCTIEKSVLFRTKVQTINIKDIRYAHFEKFGFFIRGYHGPEIKLQNGNDISIGAGSTSPFTAADQKTTEEINNYLSNSELKTLSITQKGIPTIIVAVILLLGGILSLYKALKPYIRTNDNKIKSAYNKGIETDVE